MPTEKNKRTELSPFERFIWTTGVTVLGIIPLVVFFAWFERNMDFGRPYPYFLQRRIEAILPDFPWFSVSGWTLTTQMAWNAGLFTVWGILHSAMAQFDFYEHLSRTFPTPNLRAIYSINAGISAWFVMGFWQKTNRIAWDILPDAPELSNLINFTSWYSIIALQLLLLFSLNAGEFIGIKQILYGSSSTSNNVGPMRLHTKGPFNIVRNPIHALTILNLFLTPFMSVDRLVFAVSTCFYFLWAIPLEEAKLERKFGAEYTEYKKRVPCLIPGF